MPQLYWCEKSAVNSLFPQEYQIDLIDKLQLMLREERLISDVFMNAYGLFNSFETILT
jgi:hypothetical protein